MPDKLEKLTKQIYEEGVGKAKKEASVIIDSANQERDRIVGAAKKEAESIKLAAEKDADERKKKTESELRMASQQSLAMLRQKIVDLICGDISKDAARGVFDDPQFLKKSVEVVLKTWVESGSQDKDLFLKLPKAVQKDMQGFFEHKAKQTLGKGLSVIFDEKIKSGFTVSPKDNSYRIGFTDEDFQAFVESFLRPQMRQFLFGSK